MTATAGFPPPQSPRLPAPSGRRRLASLRCIGALMLREMATTYGKSPGGYAWAVFEPVAGIAVLTLAFSFMFVKPPIGSSFELFYATGLLPFFMFNTTCNRVGTSILFSRPLLIYPAVTFVDAVLARFLVTLLTELLVFSIVMAGILHFYAIRTVIDVPAVLLSLAMLSGLALGLGTLNAYLFMRYPVWHVAWSIVNRPLFIVSGVFFMYDALPAEIRDYIWFNPLIHVIGAMRAGFYPVYNDDYIAPLYVLGLALALFLLGLRLLSWHVRWLLHEA
ncbi:MAG: ABC transporter permease [Paracoccaceae bacterium]